MFSVSPNYYAGGTVPGDFELRGGGFEKIPIDAVGFFATNNNNPLQFKDATQNTRLYRIQVVSNSLAIAHPVDPVEHSMDYYLGGIVTNDRQEVIWKNEMKPLP